MGNRRKSTQL